MDIFKALIFEANKAFNTADHLAYVTYNIVKDTKVMVLITEHLFNALTKGMDALLHIEREYKRIPQYPDSFDIKLELFKKIIQRYGISKDYIDIIKEYKEMKIWLDNNPKKLKKDYNRFIHGWLKRSHKDMPVKEKSISEQWDEQLTM